MECRALRCGILRMDHQRLTLSDNALVTFVELPAPGPLAHLAVPHRPWIVMLSAAPVTPMPVPHVRRAIVLFAVMFIAYNANGRESGSTDGQAAKYLARELVLNQTLDLNATVAAQPLLGERAAFVRDRHGNWRPAHGVVSGVIAAIPGAVLHVTGLVDLAAPRAPNLIASLTASAMTAGAVVLVFLAVRQHHHDQIALVTACALGLGTNYWAIVSRTLWQHESVALGLGLTLWSWWRPDPLARRHLIIGAAGLALAGSARMQVAPMVAVFALWIISRVGWRRAVVPTGLIALAAGVEVWRNLRWFSHVLGATPWIESLHPQLHSVPGPLAESPLWNALGLLISPSRGLFIYSPVVLTAVTALVVVFAQRRAARDLRWFALAAGVQFVVYSCYSVWWGGHTFGPRYLMDILIPLAPFGAVWASMAAGVRPARWVGGLLLLVSIAVSCLGAFVYPHERWNTYPVNIDHQHGRLWDWRDSQIYRAYRSGPSPQNFNIFNRTAVRRERE